MLNDDAKKDFERGDAVEIVMGPDVGTKGTVNLITRMPTDTELADAMGIPWLKLGLKTGDKVVKILVPGEGNVWAKRRWVDETTL